MLENVWRERRSNSEQSLEMPSVWVRKKGRSQQKGPGRSTEEQEGRQEMRILAGTVDPSRKWEAASQQEGAAFAAERLG